MEHLTTAQLEAGLNDLKQSPLNARRLKLIVRRPGEGQREICETAELSVSEGLVGDTWNQRSSSSTFDGSPHPEMQINIMNSRAAALVGQRPERWAEAGDQLYVDLNLSGANLRTGTQLEIGTALIEA